MASLLLLLCFTVDNVFQIAEELKATPELLSSLERLEEHPLDLNTSSREELLLIPYFDRYTVNRIIEYRENRPFSRESDLLHLKRITPFLYDRIKRYITVHKQTEKTVSLSDADILTRYQNKIMESQEKVYARFEIPVSGITINGVVEKDYRESNYLDYYAGSLYSPGKFVAGDYDMDIGMGILFGRPGFFYAGSGIIPGERNFRPHLSTYEENYLRGIAFKWRDISGFASYLPEEGERLAGLSYRSGPIRFTSAIVDSGTGTSRNKMFSLYLAREFAGNLLRCEIASGGAGVDDIGDNLSFAAALDNGSGIKAIYSRIATRIPTGLNSPFGKGDEELYIHYENKFIPELSGVIYCSISREISSINGFEKGGGLMLEWNPLKGVSIVNRLKIKEEKNNIRLDINYKKGDLNFRNRFETVFTDSSGSGYLAYTGIRYSEDYILEARFVIYKTDGWDSRIYEYENGLPGTFNIKQLHGSGRRIYFIAAEKVLPVILYFKWGIDIGEEINHRLGISLSI